MTGSVESRLPHLEPLETALGEPVSPELVLVDRALAERARSRLPSPDDTLARLAALVLTSRMASLTQPTADVPVRGFPPHEIEATRRARIRQRRVAALAGGVTAVTLVIASLVGVRVDVRGEPAGADIAPSGDAPVASVPRRRVPGRRRSRRFRERHDRPTANRNASRGRRLQVRRLITSSCSAARRRSSRRTRSTPRSRSRRTGRLMAECTVSSLPSTAGMSGRCPPVGAPRGRSSKRNSSSQRADLRVSPHRDLPNQHHWQGGTPPHG